MPNQVLCRADPDSRAKRERTGAGIRHNQSDIGNVVSFRPAKVSATVNWIQSEFAKIIPLGGPLICGGGDSCIAMSGNGGTSAAVFWKKGHQKSR